MSAALKAWTRSDCAGESALPVPETPPRVAELRAEARRPCSVFGPVQRVAFDIFAFICASVAIEVVSEGAGLTGPGIIPPARNDDLPLFSNPARVQFSFCSKSLV